VNLEAVGDIDWPAVGTLIALAGVIVSFWLTRRGQNQEKALAENSAERAEAAARLTEDYTARVVIALERMAALSSSTSAMAAPTPRVRFSLSYDRGDTYLLENIGDAMAQGITLGGHETLIGPDRVSGGPNLGPGEALTFMAARSMATSDSTITVSYRESPNGEELRWSYPLPSKPRR